MEVATMILSRALCCFLGVALLIGVAGCSSSGDVGQQGKKNEKREQTALVSSDSPTPPEQVEKEMGRAEVTLPNLSAHLKPWHRLKTDWCAKATIIVKGTYHEGIYPIAVFFPDGSKLVSPLRSSFDNLTVLKGRIACPSFDASVFVQDEDRFPQKFAPGRNYIVFLKPDKGSLERLNDAKATFSYYTRLDGGGEVIAIIDVSQSQAEAEAMRVQATRSETYRGFEFTPEKRSAFRDGKGEDLKTLQNLSTFIENVVATPKATLGDVRGYLGHPDYWSYRDDGIDHTYELRRREKMQTGEVASGVEMHFRGDLTLASYSIKYYKLVEGRAWQELTPDELKQIGARNVSRMFRKAQ
jgi:hypothetical protein